MNAPQALSGRILAPVDPEAPIFGDRLPVGAPASLILDDGTVFPGRVASSMNPVVGEAVFTTAMSGYPESMTDPSYRGQLLVFTYPEIGIYGVHPGDFESNGIFARALVVHRLCRHPSLQAGFVPLEQAAAAAGRGILEGVDTRAVARHLRVSGTLKAAIVSGVPSSADAIKILADQVSSDTTPLASGRLEPCPDEAASPRVALCDFGTKDGIRTALELLGARVEVFAPEAGVERLLDWKPDGILLSNGPGDPAQLDFLVDHVKALLGKRPLMGVCLGHQLLARALGARTEKLPFGHRGVNHPVRDLRMGRTYLTSQNHGYAVHSDAGNLPGVEITHVHAGDGSVEGLAHAELGCHSVQFHPEARPGPRDAAFLFEHFLDGLRTRVREGEPS